MPRQFKLTENQKAVLQRAAARSSRLIFPISDAFGDDEARVAKMLAPLRRQALVELQDHGLAITDAGITIVGADPHEKNEKRHRTGRRASSNPSKISCLAEQLSRDPGMTMEKMVALTGWKPHSIRAALTVLRKRGYIIVAVKIDGVRTFSIFAGDDE